MKPRVPRALLGLLLLGASCAGVELPPPPHPDPPLARPRALSAAMPSIAAIASTAPAPSVSALSAAAAAGAPTPIAVESAPAAAPPAAAELAADRCASVPPLGPDGAVPPVPYHAPLGIDLPIDGDRPVYVLPGEPGDPRVIVYLHGMCGDVTAADFFREAVRAHGTLIAVRGDTPCANDRFKWRDDASKIQERIVTAFKRVNAERGGELSLEHALLFGYSQGADRAEKVAARFAQQYPRLVLGGPPMKASATRLARAQRVAILGGELETTENMRAGFDALRGAGIASRFFTLECAYHGYFGIHAETQLSEVLDWVSAR